MFTLTRSSIFRKESIESQSSVTLFSRLIGWAEKQDNNRIAWMGIAIGGHGCFLTPLTVITVMLTTLNFTLFMTAFGAMALTLVTNLVALPTKITIPVFFLTVVIDILIIAVSIASII